MPRARLFQPPAVAILSAVAMETARLRQALEPVDNPAGLQLWQGMLAEQPVLLAITGIGKTNAARSTSLLLERYAPPAVIMIGAGGAYPGSGLNPGDLAVADAELFGDEGALTSRGFLDLEHLGLPQYDCGTKRYYNRVPCSRELLEALLPTFRSVAARHQRALSCGLFVTVSSCSGSDSLGAERGARTGGLCENMEGAAAALCCLYQDVPFCELRGISNLVEERDPNRWDLAAAAAISQDALLAALAQWPISEGR